MADNDFLQQVKDMEQKASDLIKKALKKKNDDLVKFKQEMAEKGENDFKLAQEAMKTELENSKKNLRKKYEEELLEGTKKADEFKSEKINAIAGLLGEAENLFLSII